MKKLIAGVLLVALSEVPSVASAELNANAASRAAVAGAPAKPAAQPTAPAPAPTSEASEYAGREAAAPQLGEFEGGHRGVYIGGGAVTVLLIVLLVLLLV